MTHPVFISYARDASRDHAVALHKALGGRTAFLDTDAIAIGERFPEALVDALFGARVVVIFAEPAYFTRWYCLLEFRIARTPFLRAAERPGATAQEKEDALRGLVVAMPPRGESPMLERFPPLLRARNWPDVGNIERIAELVDAELAANPPTLRERYASAAEADAARAVLLDATRLPPPLKIGSVPFVPQTRLPKSIGDAFVGRADDLWRIHDLLWTERGDPATSAALTGSIEAIGGFGKTRLALEYLYRFGPRHFRGGLFWIDAESDPELQLYEVLQALNPKAPAIEEIRQGSGGVPGAVARAIRARPDDAPTPLFVIDNVPEPTADQRPKPLEDWCPVLGEVPVLTTSRTHLSTGAGAGIVALPIETLDPISAVKLLTAETDRSPLSDAEWDAIAAWVGNLPLALEVLSRLLRLGEMTPRSLLELSHGQGPSTAIDDAMESIRHAVPAGALRGITEAFSASYRLLTAEEQRAARLIAWMSPAPVPTFVIDALGPEVFPQGVRSKLRNRSFVTEVREGSGAFYGAMHRVLADFLRGQIPSPAGDIETVAEVLNRLTESAEGRGTVGSAVVRECAALASSLFGNWIATAETDETFDEASEFANDFGRTLARWGYPALAADLFASLAVVFRQRLGDEHPATLAAMNNLALTHRERGDYGGARELFERVLEAMLRVYGDEHYQTILAVGNLGATRYGLGHFSEAERLQDQGLETSRRILGAEHPDTLSAMNNLAVTRRRRGDYLGAKELLEQVLEVRRRVFGEEDPVTLTTMGNLAGTLRDGGDFGGAQELLERVLKALKRIWGDEHPNTLVAMSNLALARRDLGNLAGARELQEEVFESRRRILGIAHPDTHLAISRLAITRRELGDHLGAQDLEDLLASLVSDWTGERA